MKKIKVMQFIHSLSYGGAETLVKDYCLKLDKEKFEVVVLCFMRTPNCIYEELLKNAGIRVICIGDYQNHSNKLLPKLVRGITRFFYVRKLIWQEKPDVLHTHLVVNSFVRFANPPGSLCIVHTIHNEPQALWFSDGWKRKRDFKNALWQKKKYNMRLIALHENMRREVNQLFQTDDTLILNNGINFKNFESLPSKLVIRQRLEIPEDGFVIGHVGRFIEAKNQAFLVRVFKKVSDINKKAFLLMIGSGKKMNEIKRLIHTCGIEDNVMILSDRKDVPELMSAMDVFCFPSLYEGLSVTMIEAQISGLPIVCSDRIDKQTIISNLVEQIPLEESEQVWADALLKEKDYEITYFGKEDWDMDNIVRQLENIYISLVTENN